MMSQNYTRSEYDHCVYFKFFIMAYSLFWCFMLMTCFEQARTWLMHLFMVQVEVQVGAWLMHLFMVQVDYRLRYMLVHGSCTCLWYRLRYRLMHG
jgi:hypothetical protein